MDEQITKDIIKVTRGQIGLNGQENLEIEYDRINQKTTLKVNGELVWGVCGKWAEIFFNKYGLLIR